MSTAFFILSAYYITGDVFLTHSLKLNISSKAALKNATTRYFKELQPNSFKINSEFDRHMIIAIQEDHVDPIEFLLRNVHKGYEPGGPNDENRNNKDFIYSRLLKLSTSHLWRIVRIMAEVPNESATPQEVKEIGYRNLYLSLLLHQIVNEVIESPDSFILFVKSQESKLLPDQYTRFVKAVRDSLPSQFKK
jgi:hypothetical protein